MKNYKKFLDTPFPDLTPPRRFRCLDAPAFHGQLPRMSSDPRNAPAPLHFHPLHNSKTSTGHPLNGEYISNWPPWHCTLASHLTCPNCYNIMNPHGLCDLPLLFNSLFHDTTLNLARVHFESQHQKSGISSIRNSPSLPTFRRHLKHIIFSQPILTPNDHPLSTRPDSL